MNPIMDAPLAAAALFVGYALLPTGCCFGRQYCRRMKRRRDPRLFLTFDDGPSVRYTGAFLDLLRDYQIHATFFVVASFAGDNPELIARMRQEGHLVCLHSYAHADGWLEPPAKTEQDFRQSLAVMDALNQRVRYYRPPFGLLSLSAVRELRRYGLSPVLWDVMTQDWRGDTSAQIIAGKLLRRAKGGRIICLHDGRGTNCAPGRTLEALKMTLPVLLRAGYRFDTIDHYEA